MESSNSYTICAPDSPTHHSYNPQHLPKVLDLAMLNLKDRNYTITNHNDLSSDYNPIIRVPTTNLQLRQNIEPPKAKKNWKNYEAYLRANPQKSTNASKTLKTYIKKKIETLTKTIQSTLENNSYTVKHPAGNK